MKKLIFILAMCIATNALAQNSFPTENAIWNESIRGDYRIFGLLGDTTFNGITYSKLYLLADTIIPEESGGLWCVGAFRNEGQKVYFKPVNWEYLDILLYDFGAEVGDTIWHNAWMPPYEGYYINIEPCSDCYSIVSNIAIDEDGRKIYWVGCPSPPHLSWNGRWYEGIGSDKGVLFSLQSSFPDYWSYEDFQLNCFKHNDTVKYLNNPKCNKCFCTFVNITENLSDTIKIFPNPTNDILNIETPNNINIKSISIYNMDGKLIEKNMCFLNSGQLNISKLTSGSYIINFETDKGNFSQIIIKN